MAIEGVNPPASGLKRFAELLGHPHHGGRDGLDLVSKTVGRSRDRDRGDRLPTGVDDRCCDAGDVIVVIDRCPPARSCFADVIAEVIEIHVVTGGVDLSTDLLEEHQLISIVHRGEDRTSHGGSMKRGFRADGGTDPDRPVGLFLCDVDHVQPFADRQVHCLSTGVSESRKVWLCALRELLLTGLVLARQPQTTATENVATVGAALLNVTEITQSGQ